MNRCSPYSEVYPDPTMHPLTITIFSVLYSLIFIFGFLGNVVVMIVTLNNRSLQSVQNLFLLNLAASDIIMCLMSIPLTPVTLIMKEWYFGAVACKLVGFIQALGLFISTFSLCAIGIDRYIRLVLAPGRPLMRQQAVHITAFIWILSLLISAPYVYYITLKSYPNICGVFCTEDWPNDRSRRVYTFLVLAVQCIIPLVILTLSYHAIFAFLAQRAECRIITITKQTNFLSLLASASQSSADHYQEQLMYLSKQKKHLWRQKKRVTLLLIMTVTVFGLTALPHNIASVIYEYDTDYSLLTINGYDLSYLISLFAHCMAMACCVANPVLYAFLNPEFRNSIMRKRLYVNRTLQTIRTYPSEHH